MKYNRFYIANIIISLLLTCTSIMAAEDFGADMAGAQAETETLALTEKEKFYGTALRADEKVVHPPYEWGDCTVCHEGANPEDGEDLKLDTPELCYQCHEPKDTKNFIHGPVGAGACTACHNPHESPNAKLLVRASINELCTSCHEAKDKFLHNTTYIHPPVKDQCTNCHDPHTEDNLYQLKADRKKDICLMCHVDKKVWIAEVTDKHGAIDRPRKCLECHDPHGSEHPKFIIKDTAKELCLTCHNESLKTDETGYKLQNIAKHLEDNPDWHGPILWGDCAACHNPHGSNNLRMLKKPFPRTFYESFDEKNYICFQCHEPDKIKAEFTIEATNFRNGDKNIHFVHVNKIKGRSCRACHDFHGTKEYPHHLRKKTQFGRINFPIRYIETENGGSCAPACHARRHYDRETPKVNLK
ncbi:cytochrome C [Candidatus Sulfurimonas marisnigri]|uniref:Cytochrome C n=1 Tax=Candidatus Sulfurimonas marisnigri TaxID=2740405 RepID=A0A7S7RQB6_9BACT|nr:cytochrome c3 family protein [Candidatus Sulfurimonas marisnigri]QOY54449.1 cytochrome C [Candidatus Sulfurimonas marisnigri]